MEISCRLSKNGASEKVSVFRPKLDPMCCVHLEQKNRGSANGCGAVNTPVFNSEVFSPHMRSRVEQRSETAAVGVDAREIRAFQQIAVVARECEVFKTVGTFMLTRHDVFSVIREIRLPVFRHETVFATRVGPITNNASVACPDAHQREANLRRAFDCSTPRKFANITQLSYSERSSGVSAPSFARSASHSIRSAASGLARRLTSAWSDGASRQSVTGDIRESKDVAFMVPTIYRKLGPARVLKMCISKSR